MSVNLQCVAAVQVESWFANVSVLGLAPVIQMVEDQVRSLASEMTGGVVKEIDRIVHQGLPVWVPAQSGEMPVQVNAPGEGADGAVAVPQLLVGMAITANAAEYLYFGADHRFAVTKAIKAYKYLVQAEAVRLAVDVLDPEPAQQYAEVLGVDW